jgi:hypothetical protein
MGGGEGLLWYPCKVQHRFPTMHDLALCHQVANANIQYWQHYTILTTLSFSPNPSKTSHSKSPQTRAQNCQFGHIVPRLQILVGTYIPKCANRSPWRWHDIPEKLSCSSILKWPVTAMGTHCHVIHMNSLWKVVLKHILLICALCRFSALSWGINLQ